MNNLLWMAVNLIGIAILAFMYSYMGKSLRNRKGEAQPFMFLQLVIMLFLLFDTGMYLIEGHNFTGAIVINYVFSMLFYITLPLIGFAYFLYCTSFVSIAGISRKKAVLFSIPALMNVGMVFLTPITKFLFYIEENNVYTRGNLFWTTFTITLIYVLAAYLQLIFKSGNKNKETYKSSDIYLYLFPIMPVIFGVLQVIYYGTALTGIGFVLAALVMYVRNITHSEEKNSLSVRFLVISIAQFSTVFIIMTVGLFLTLNSAIDDISEDYAVYNSINTANTIKIYLSKEISVLGTTVKSTTVTDWFENPDDPQLKEMALEELFRSIDILYNNNLFIVLEGSRQGFAITGGALKNEISEPMHIHSENESDAWYFELKEVPKDYFLDVDVYNERRAVWLNFKVLDEDGEFIGALSTDMDISTVTEQAVTQYRDNNTRVLLLDRKGQIQADSYFINNEEFHLYGANRHIKDEITDAQFIDAITTHLNSIDSYFDEFTTSSQIITLRHGQYHYATITPVGMTDWTVIKLFDSSSLFAMSRLVPPFIIITALFVLFVFSSNRELQRLIFTPLRLLVDSLVSMRGKRDKDIYGLERDDEFGLLSNTIHDLFIVGHYDPLTGIYNRRYMETTLTHVISSLSRAGAGLSLLMLDLDNFKKYNDTYGHAAGDECLKSVSGALESVVKREGDFVARYGGEEFIVALPNTDKDGAVMVADAILKAVRELKILHEKNEAGIVTISVGVATHECTDNLTWNDFVKMADEALYESKENGRDRYTFYVDKL
ncbi:MAG: diguanylate cyclase [Oscillospiraceae bacterium]|nr:diguanylate cyclase [Oscillospiraceae bacterium]